MKKKRAVVAAYADLGVKGTLSHISGRLFGLPKYLRSASSIDFRHARLTSAKTLEEFISILLPESKGSEISKSLTKAKKLVDSLQTEKVKELNAPERWNSGKDLQYLLTTLVLLLKPEIVVETGTANGASAAATAIGLKTNKIGRLISFDIADLDPVLLPRELRYLVQLIQVGGSPEEIESALNKIDLKKKSIFLHDSDHSYLGQLSDYQIAKNKGFDILLSDDIDASLAFSDFAKDRGVIYFDAPKFIGGVRLKR